MFIFTHTDGKTYELAFKYTGTKWPDGNPICFGITENIAKWGRFYVQANLYEIVGTLELPHETKGRVFVPEKSLRGTQTLVAGENDFKVSKKQLRERALSNLLKRKGFTRAERLAVFGAYYAKIRQSQLASAALREAGYRRETEKVTVTNAV